MSGPDDADRRLAEVRAMLAEQGELAAQAFKDLVSALVAVARRPPAGTHPAVELRIRCPAGDLVLADSDRLNLISRFGMPPGAVCGFGCPPGCREHGWFQLFPGDGVAFAGGGDLVIEVRPVDLPNYVPDDDDDEQEDE